MTIKNQIITNEHNYLCKFTSGRNFFLMISENNQVHSFGISDYGSHGHEKTHIIKFPKLIKNIYHS